MSDGRDKRRDWRSLRIAAGLSGVGLTLALSVGVGIGIGLLLDRWLKTNGFAVIICSLLGIVAGFKQLIQTVMQAGREQDRIEAQEREQRRQEALANPTPPPAQPLDPLDFGWEEDEADPSAPDR